MNIASIKIKNFRCFEDREFTFTPGVNWFLGTNRSGKSTIADAISVALAGRCRGAENGRDLDGLRRTGSKKKWEIELTIAGDPGQVGAPITRREGEGPKSATGQIIEGRVGPSGRVSACLNAGEFWRLSLRERQELLMNLSPAAEGIEIDPVLATLIMRHCNLNIAGGPGASVEEIREAHDRSYAVRTEIGRAVKAMGAAKPEPEDVGPMSNSGLTDLLRSGEEAIRNHEATRERIQTAWKRLGLEPGGPPIENPYDLESANQAAMDSAEEVARLEGEIETHQAVYDALGRALEIEGECPLCLHHASEKAKAILKTKAKDLDGTMGSMRDDLEKFQTLVQQAQELQKLAKEAGTQESARKELERVTAEERAYDMAAAKKRLEELRGEASRLEEMAGERRRWAQDQVDRKKLADRLAEVESIVEACGPKGLMKDAASSAPASEFAVSLGKALGFLGFPKVDMGPAVRAEGEPTINGYSSKLLSESEKLQFGLAFQAACARMSLDGLGIIMVDNLDCTVEAERARTESFLKGCGLQCFVFEAAPGPLRVR